MKLDERFEFRGVTVFRLVGVDLADTNRPEASRFRFWLGEFALEVRERVLVVAEVNRPDASRRNEVVWRVVPVARFDLFVFAIMFFVEACSFPQLYLTFCENWKSLAISVFIYEELCGKVYSLEFSRKPPDSCKAIKARTIASIKVAPYSHSSPIWA